jgi:protein TonB
LGPGRIAGGGAMVWICAAVAALAAHGALALLALRQTDALPAGLPTPPAILLDLSPAAPQASQTEAAPDRLDAPDIPAVAAPELTAAPPPPSPLPLDAPDPPEPPPEPLAAPAPIVPRPEPRPARKAPPPSQAARAPTVATPKIAPAPAAPRQAPGRQGTTSPEAWGPRVMAHLQRRMIYPPRALAEGIVGTAVVNIRLDAAGKVRKARLVRSSGDRDLDAAALTAVRLASPLPKPPPGQELEVTAPLRYNQRAAP